MVLTKEVIDKVEYIIQQIENGITREQLAEEFGNKDYKALDMYMRRRGYTWDAELGNYILRDSKVKSNEFRNSKIQSGKVAEIINLFRQGLDAKAVAEQLFFPSHRALAKYMAQQGYVWDIKEKNYVQKVGLDIENDTEVKEIKEPISQVEQVPRYLIPGITKNKNITMSHLLDQLLTDYSREKNIKQKEIVEVALIEFFTKYGYVHEVKALLNR
ncbi:hypothetical protein ACFPN4_00430 [Ureibacillus thermophilus]|uniref:hypothetical protein n=1 Tax=Ureibacillus thermophilus TaxID=367743 RepID=UPI0036207506